MNLAVTVGTKVTLSSSDPTYSLVVAWALFAIADDLQPSKSYLRKSGLVGNDALDTLETTALFSANLQVGAGRHGCRTGGRYSRCLVSHKGGNPRVGSEQRVTCALSAAPAAGVRGGSGVAVEGGPVAQLGGPRRLAVLVEAGR